MNNGDKAVSQLTIRVDAKGEALLTYRKGGKVKHVLVWGAVNALPPKAGGAHVKFKVDYAGGWGKYHKLYWKTFEKACRPYDGPAGGYVARAGKARASTRTP